MGEFRRASTERVNVFPDGDRLVFKQYFEEDAVFDRLRRYYNGDEYRFEVPPEDFDGVEHFLERHGYGLVVVEDVTPFTVVVRKYTDHPEDIFRNAVLHRSEPRHNLFVMRDRAAVEQATLQGAVPLAEADLADPFG
ncbi:MAG: hypothetical protein ABEJ42_03675 [Halobacteriaceae archaeon]